MIATIALWLAVAGFAGAGVFNAMSTPATRSDFVRWGFPYWWGRVTGLLEVASAILIALPATRSAGLALGAFVIVAAAWTVLRHGEFNHLVPLGVFGAVLALAFMPYR